MRLITSTQHSEVNLSEIKQKLLPTFCWTSFFLYFLSYAVFIRKNGWLNGVRFDDQTANDVMEGKKKPSRRETLPFSWERISWTFVKRFNWLGQLFNSILILLRGYVCSWFPRWGENNARLRSSCMLLGFLHSVLFSFIDSVTSTNPIRAASFF